MINRKKKNKNKLSDQKTVQCFNQRVLPVANNTASYGEAIEGKVLPIFEIGIKF